MIPGVLSTGPLIRYGAVIVFIGLVLGGLAKCSYTAGRDKVQSKLDAANAKHAAVIADLAAKTKIAADKARSASEAVKRERTENDQRLEEQAHESDREIADLRRQLRDGTARLQPWWSCPAAGADPGDAAALAGGQDGYADLRNEDALANVRDADAADRWIEWLQFELVSTREALKAAGLAVEPQP